MLTRKHREISDTNEILSFLKKGFHIGMKERGTRKKSRTTYRFHEKEPRVMLSKNSRKFIEELYSKIRNVGIFHYSLETVSKKEVTPIHSYIPKEIAEHLRHDIAGRRAIISIGQRIIEIECIIPLYGENQIFQNREKTDEFVNNCIYKIYLWLSIAFSYAPSHCARVLKIYLYMTLDKKVLPSQIGSPIGQIHANTAFTTACAPINEINIYRKEEWFKVFIHETFHSLGLDFSTMDSTTANAKICSIFHVKSDVRLYETYCEMWAEMIQILFYLYMEKNTPISRVIHTFLKCIRYEKMFSVFQSVKILRFFGIQYKDLLKYNENTIAKYKESTQILSYYILKSIAMVYINDFIEWCIKHNTNILDFTKTESNIDAYCDFFEKHSNMSKYLEYVNMAESVFQEDEGNSIPISILETMRMTVYA
jgi:hypothetical protein